MIGGTYSALIPSGNPGMEGPVSVLYPDDTISPQEELYTVAMLEAIRSIERGTFALVPDALGREVIEDSVCTALFNELPELARTRQNSAHEVKFGQLVVKSMFGEERSEFVAAKQFEMPADIATEFSLSRYFSAPDERPFSTFKPVGIARDSKGRFEMLTKYEHGVRSLDNVFLNPEFEDEAILIMRMVGKCAFLLGSIHSEGYTHGDAQAKNMFVSNNHERVFVADLESMRPFPMSHGHPIEGRIENQVNRDLVTLVDSMRRSEHGVRDFTAQSKEMFALIYSSIVNSQQSKLPKTIRKSILDIKDYFNNPDSPAAA